MTLGDMCTYSIKAAQVEATNIKAMTDKGIDLMRNLTKHNDY